MKGRGRAFPSDCRNSGNGLYKIKEKEAGNAAHQLIDPGGIFVLAFNFPASDPFWKGWLPQPRRQDNRSIWRLPL